MLEAKKIAAISEADLQSLLEREIPESRLLDYKRELLCSNDGDKKEFLFDVSSFANASGGHLIYGVDEESGIPTQMNGITILDPDAETQKLESLILTGIDPRIPGVELRFIQLANAKHVLVIHIPKSWASPHMVTLKGTDKFYSRNNAGKYKLDVRELRSLFSLSDSIVDQIRKFRTERLSQIIADETPVSLKSFPKIILHIIPLQSFSLATKVNLESAQRLFLFPLGQSGCDTRVNLDGLLNFPSFQKPRADAYLQLYHNGIIETVNSDILAMNGTSSSSESPLSLIPSTVFESKIIQHSRKYIDALKKLGLNPPFVVMLTLVGVKNYAMAVEYGFSPAYKIDRDLLFIPELFLEKSDCNPSDFKPILDAVWNASGKYGSPNFDENGEWIAPC